MDASWRRRRLFSAAMLACGLVLLLLHPFAPIFRTKCLLLAPAVILWGLAGLIHPPIMLDPTLDYDSLDREQMRSLGRKWEFWVGLACIPIGLGVGAVLVFVL